MLPVRELQHDILAKLAASNRLVISAPTGSGKTTQVPQMLLEREAAKGQIIVLQPRRLATRMVARRVADEMKTPLGQLVGYQTRHDSMISHQTRIRFMTEGLFLRLMQSNPQLPGVGAVVLDEFHERNLDADLSLGLLKQLQESPRGRSDLRVIVMSATLDVQAIRGYLQCDAIETMGRTYPVEVSYLPKWSQAPAWDLAAEALRDLLDAEADGDVLIFMPGAYEIRRTVEACQRAVGRDGLAFFPLHGSLPAVEQDAAVSPHRLRKVIVATNVAETSITIPGVMHVIDSGLARVHRFDARRGINVLELASISQASADQRAGRAGRTAPGTCRRLWTQADHRTRPLHETPEVRRLELSQAALQMLDMRIDPREFPWLEPPEEAAVGRALDVLSQLGAIESRDVAQLTELGRRMARFPMHPRLARMLIEAEARGCLGRATLWAAIIGERDILIGEPKPIFRTPEPDQPASDLVVLERAFDACRQGRFDPRRCGDLGAHANGCREVERTYRLYVEFCRRLEMRLSGDDRTADLVKSLLIAFADHVAVRREAGRLDCAMPGQKRVALDRASVVKRPGPLVALEVHEIGRGKSVETVLSIASEVEVAWLDELFPSRMTTRIERLWNDELNAVEEVEQRLFGELVVWQKARPAADPGAAGEMIARQVIAGELKFEQWDEKVEQWITRVRCVAGWFPERGLIRYDPDDLAVIVHEIVGEATRWNEVKGRSVLQAVRDALSWDEQQFIEKMTPETIRLPSGEPMKIEYQIGAAPRGRAKIQHLYDLTDTPRIAAGRVKIVLEILGPNYRPVQITDDLASFWANMYPALKKELKRRYPKHEWR